MRIRRYLDRKKLTRSEAAEVPRYVLNYLRAHDRPLYIQPLQVEEPLPSTAGKTT